ncbi:hypothetical protein BGM09_01130 [Streptomyces sp. CBMA29]|nr:hypothetical protein [Streptomyces sp. CBMA29]
MSLAAFVGPHSAGPTRPQIISSWTEFQTLYRGFGNGTSYLPFAAYQYFANGGRQAAIVRAVPSDSVAATLTVKNRPILPAQLLVPTVSTALGTGGVAPTVAVANIRAGTGAGVEETGITVLWDAPTSVPDFYQLTWVVQGQTTPVGGPVNVAAPATQAVITGLTPGTAYAVTVAQVKGAAVQTANLGTGTVTTKSGPAAVDALKVTALGAGAYGNSIYVDITPSWDSATNRFHLFVKDGTAAAGSIVERWQDVSLDPADSRYAIGLVNSPNAGSKYISLTNLLPPGSPVSGTGQTPDASWYPVPTTAAPLINGADGVATISIPDAVATLDSLDAMLVLNAPAVSDATVVNALLAWAEARGNAFVMVDPPATTASDPATAVASYLALMPASTVTGPTPYAASSYGAVYGPWLQASDPAGTSVSATRLLPPGGAMAGRYAAADLAEGPHVPAAGVDYPLIGVLGVEHLLTATQLDDLNEAGFNVVRPLPQAGICAMGVRTPRPGMPDRYIPVRRTLIHVKSLLVDATRFSVFKPNGPDLWSTLTAIVQQQCDAFLAAGLLKGATAGDAYFVLCDETNNPPNTVANGEVHIQVGVAVASPAEFVILDIGQYQGGATTSETGL